MGGKPLHPEAWVEDDEPAPPSPQTATPRDRRSRKATKPVTFLCPSVPALGLGLPSGFVAFQYGKLTLSDPRDIEAIRRHGWHGTRIVEETPETVAQLEADAALHRQLRQKQQELADEAQAKRRMQGPRGPLIEWAQRRR
jgi:hypothetical protein